MKSRHWNFLPLVCAAVLGLAGPGRTQEPKQPELLVFAAASLTNVLGELAANWEKTSGVPVKLSFAASSALARQIEAGGAADVFLSADQEWMDYLEARGLLRKDSRREIVNHRCRWPARITATQNFRAAGIQNIHSEIIISI